MFHNSYEAYHTRRFCEAFSRGLKTGHESDGAIDLRRFLGRLLG